MTRRVRRVRDGVAEDAEDHLPPEEPLELRLAAGGEAHPFAVTMRTPGSDRDLALGLLLSEGAIAGAADVLALDVWREAGRDFPNVLRVELGSGLAALSRARAGFAASACGVCGPGGLERLAVRAAPARWTAPPLAPALVLDLPRRLRARQPGFDRTGGLHGAALFTPGGDLLVAREDVGRHNAVDKAVGWAMGEGRVPLSDHVLAVSGRVGYEIAQKAAVAGVPVIVAVSAPTDLAVDVAEHFGITLVGFARGEGFNVYSHPKRVGTFAPR